MIRLRRDAGWQADLLAPVRGSQVPGLVLFGTAAVLVSWVCAVASWHLLERPVLRWKRYFPYAVAPDPAILSTGVPADDRVPT